MEGFLVAKVIGVYELSGNQDIEKVVGKKNFL